jgi:UDP-N-acetylglucosamine 2-epimerase (non-hydrolysing)
MAALDSAVDHKIIHTGQNYDYELNKVFFDEMSIRKPDYQLDHEPSTFSESIGDMMVGLEERLRALDPDALLILGDTNSCVAAAYVAKRLKIPLFHMEAGNRCFDERVPEEVNRRIVDTLSDINMPYSDLARENLMREGFPTDRVIKTGSPMNEVLGHYQIDIWASKVLQRKGLNEKQYFVVSCHREENVDSPEKFHQLCGLLNALADKYHERIIVSAHPRVKSKFTTWGDFRNEVEFYKPFGFFDYLKLQKHAHCTLSDSGTITEESAIECFPALNLREAHERPEGMEEASVIMTGFNVARVLESIDEAQTIMLIPDDYLSRYASNKVVRIVLSYVDYVNRKVWHK